MNTPIPQSLFSRLFFNALALCMLLTLAFTLLILPLYWLSLYAFLFLHAFGFL